MPVVEARQHFQLRKVAPLRQYLICEFLEFILKMLTSSVNIQKINLYLKYIA